MFVDKLVLANTTRHPGLELRSSYTRLNDVVIANTAKMSLAVGHAATDVVLSNVTASSSGKGVHLVLLDNTSRVTLQNLLLVNAGHASLTAEASLASNASDTTVVHFASAGATDADIRFSVADGNSIRLDFAFHGALLTAGKCTVSNAINPGVTSTCDPAGGSQAVAGPAPDPGSLLVGAVQADDAENPSDNAQGEASHALNLDFVQFENRYRVWIPDTKTKTPTAHGPWTSGQGAIWDFSLRKGADPSVYQRIPAPVHGAACPMEVHGDQIATDHRGDTFLKNATEILFDYVGDDDGLCETNEHCIHAPNIGAYQGHGDPATVRCVFADGKDPKSASGVTMFAHPDNGRY